MPATVIVGAQWGDEGKGKIVDLLAQDSDLVCRYQGGPNAGHTIVVDGETYKIRQIPSGIVAGKASAIGAGCVVDPRVVIDELDDLEGRGHTTKGLVFISGNAHLIMPWHVALDGARERKLGNLQIGTTRRGIGPAYADKATRIGIRVQDLLDPKILRQKIELAITEKNVWLERVYEIAPVDLEEVAQTYEGYAQRLRPYVADTSLLVDRALRNGDNVLFEGAQGTLLDLDHGTYPFVTSSSPIAAGAAVSFGIGPNRIDEILGVSKAYVTRVGEGPFPSEIEGEAQERVRELGGEFGTVTGRERRCGWLDLPALRFAVRVNGITSLALTKLDVLSTFAEIPVCVRYALPDGSETDDFPAHQSDFHHCRPVWETLPGWQEEIDGTTLPDAAAAYVRFVEDALGVPVSLVGTGQGREAVLTLPQSERVTVSRLRGVPGIGVDRMGDAADGAADPELLRLENLDTDLGPLAAAIEATHAAIDDDDANSYLPFPGHERLRRVVARHVGRGVREIDWRRTLITAGGLNGILNVLLATLEPGDEVVLTDPVYAGLLNRVRVAGGVPRLARLEPTAAGWSLDLDSLRAAATDRTRALLMMSPSMPSGSVLDREAWGVVADLCRERDLLLIVDTAMERIVFDGRDVFDPLSLDGMEDRTIIVGSASKELRMIGWRVGWVVAPPALVDDIGLVGISNVVCQVGIAQTAVAIALEAGDADVGAATAEWQRRRDVILAELDGLPVIPPHGGWSMLLDVRSLGHSADEASERLFRLGRIAATPMTNWGSERAGDYVRFVFANESCERLRGFGDRVRSSLT